MVIDFFRFYVKRFPVESQILDIKLALFPIRPPLILTAKINLKHLSIKQSIDPSCFILLFFLIKIGQTRPNNLHVS